MKSQLTDSRPGPVLDPEPLDLGSPARGHRRWPWVILVLIVLAGLLLSTRSNSKKAEGAPDAAAARAAARPVPVLTSIAKAGDLGEYLTGLGTVTPLATVVVRSRVDGQLMTVRFREGQPVREGELLAEIDPRPFQVQLTQAEGQLAKDEAALEVAKRDLSRFQSLIADGLIPQQQLDAQEATVSQAQASIQSDQGSIDGAKLNLTYSRITAPITGRVGLRAVDAGNMVHASDPNGIAVITQLEPINVLFTIPADRLEQVLGPLRADRRLAVDAYDRDLKKKLATGWLSAVDNQIDQSTGTVRLKALFPNADGALFPNQFVNARLLVDTVSDAVLVPAAAIQRSPQSAFVWLVGPDSTVAMRDVKVRLTEGDVTAVDGLSAGDSVVVDGVDKLQAGSKVAVAARGASGVSGSPAPAPGSGEAGRKRKP